VSVEKSVFSAFFRDLLNRMFRGWRTNFGRQSWPSARAPPALIYDLQCSNLGAPPRFMGRFAAGGKTQKLREESFTRAKSRAAH